MNIISSSNFVQLHCFIGSNEEEFAGDTETDITGTVGEESETSHHRYRLEQPEN